MNRNVSFSLDSSLAENIEKKKAPVFCIRGEAPDPKNIIRAHFGGAVTPLTRQLPFLQTLKGLQTAGKMEAHRDHFIGNSHRRIFRIGPICYKAAMRDFT